MNYIIMHGAHSPISGENPKRSERSTAKEALQLLEEIKTDQKIVLILDGDGKQMTGDALARAASDEKSSTRNDGA